MSDERDYAEEASNQALMESEREPYRAPGYGRRSYPSLTWGYVKSWATQAGVPDSAVMFDDSRNSERLYGIHRAQELMVFRHKQDPGQEQLTWGDVKRMAGQLQIEDDARLRDDSERRYIDLNSASDVFRLQHRWG